MGLACVPTPSREPVTLSTDNHSPNTGTGPGAGGTGTVDFVRVGPWVGWGRVVSGRAGSFAIFLSRFASSRCGRLGARRGRCGRRESADDGRTASPAWHIACSSVSVERAARRLTGGRPAVRAGREVRGRSEHALDPLRVCSPGAEVALSAAARGPPSPSVRRLVPRVLSWCSRRGSCGLTPRQPCPGAPRRPARRAHAPPRAISVALLPLSLLSPLSQVSTLALPLREGQLCRAPA